MTLLASVASLFCTFSVSAATPSVAVVPEGTVNRVEIISPSLESPTVFAVDLQVADDDGNVADAGNESPDLTPDKVADARSDADFLPADVVTPDEEILPADVVVDGEDILPADVVVDGEDILPADVVAGIEAGFDPVSELDNAPVAEAAADAGTLIDEQPEEDLAPTAPPSEEPGAKSDAGDSSGDGEAAS